MAGVEFVEDDPRPEPGGGVDVLDVGRTSRLPSVASWLRVVLVAAIVLGGGGIWLATRPGDRNHPAPQAIVSPAQTTAAPFSALDPSSSVVLDPVTGRVVGSERCPRASYCMTSVAVPADVRSAVRKYLPTAGPPAVWTVTRKEAASDTPELWSRDIETHIGAVDVLIRMSFGVLPTPTPTAALTPTPPGLASALVQIQTAGYSIEMQWTGPETVPPPMMNLNDLADDPRLAALP